MKRDFKYYYSECRLECVCDSHPSQFESEDQRRVGGLVEAELEENAAS